MDLLERVRPAIDLDLRAGGEGVHDVNDVDITHITHDSRAVREGSIFCAVPGRHVDGHDYVAAAVAAGARAALVERAVRAPVPLLVAHSARRAMGPIASALYGAPSQTLKVIGVTGTNGKTTTVHLLAGILNRAGERAQMIGTLTGARTTPEAPDLQDILAEFRDRGATAVAMEVSSHALDQYRVEGTSFAAAVFTNLSPDHLDYHRSMEEYFRAKARLFEPQFTSIAVIDVSTPYGLLLAQSAQLPHIIRSGPSTVDVLEIGLTRSSFRWQGDVVRLPLGGSFNISNAVLAADTAAALGVATGTIVEALERATAVPGRFENIDEGQPFTVIVDYAHTPDGLAHVLASAREVGRDGRVIVVFGCGGDRDASKRPLMGGEAERGADIVIVTSDNPRHEDPQAIIDAVVAGMNRPPAAQLLDRRDAIARAIGSAAPRDVVVIAGKGHEATQQVGDRFTAFDDRVVARELLRAAGYPGPGGAQ